MLRYSTAMICWVMFAAVAQAQEAAPAAPLPSMPAMPGTPTVVVEQPAAPIELPEVQIPSVAVPPVAEPAATPVVEQPVIALPPQEKPATNSDIADDGFAFPMLGADAEYSYGASGLSILFTPAQSRRMKNVLSAYEAARRNRSDVGIQVVEDIASVFTPEPEVVEEPKLYPAFTLKSIAYRNPSDWTVWIGDLRITPLKNKQEVRVLAVSPDRAQFLWKPTYAQALQMRNNLKRFVSTAKVKHKLTSANTAIFDAAAGQATFTLRPNQTFVPGYMATFEGKVVSPEMEPMKDDDGMGDLDEKTDITPADTAPEPANTSAEDPNNLDALLKTQQRGAVRSVFQRSMQVPPSAAPTN